jgi:Histidine phosphatase superfamily (branch 2)
MTQSAEYFLAGFFGLGWTQNASLLLMIEDSGFNNSLAGYFKCPNSDYKVSSSGDKAKAQWTSIYLKDATKRIQSQITGFNWTLNDSYNAQSLCAYETVALGYSSFCSLFTYDEWKGYEYSADLSFAGNNAFQSPTGRAVGIGWVQELLARLQHHTIDGPMANVNWTLDSNPETFPINQRLNFDFSHDTNIMSILTAFGLKQFATYLPPDQIIEHDLVVSHLEPFGARLDIEIIDSPMPVAPNRTSGRDAYMPGNAIQYIHFILNQRTIPLGRSFPECGNRSDGWCELGTFLHVQSSKLKESQYEHACFGNYSAVPYGKITDGVPLGHH